MDRRKKLHILCKRFCAKDRQRVVLVNTGKKATEHEQQAQRTAQAARNYVVVSVTGSTSKQSKAERASLTSPDPLDPRPSTVDGATSVIMSGCLYNGLRLDMCHSQAQSPALFVFSTALCFSSLACSSTTTAYYVFPIYYVVFADFVNASSMHKTTQQVYNS